MKVECCAVAPEMFEMTEVSPILYFSEARSLPQPNILVMIALVARGVCVHRSVPHGQTTRVYDDNLDHAKTDIEISSVLHDGRASTSRA